MLADTLRTDPRTCVLGGAQVSLLSCQCEEVRSPLLRLQTPCVKAVQPSHILRKTLPYSICLEGCFLAAGADGPGVAADRGSERGGWVHRLVRALERE